jgi:neutral ceramidase
VYLNGACGNQSPRRVVRAQTFAEAERIGTALGERMAEAIRAADARTPAPHFPLRALSVDLNIQGKRFPEVTTAEAKLSAARKRFEELRDASAERHLVRTAECTVFGAEEVLTLARAEAAGDAEALRQRCARAEIQVFLVGDCAVSAWPGEFFVEYALELKARSPIPVFPVTLANGELQGYVVTPEAERANGYESQMSLFPATVGARFVDTTLTLLRRIGLSNNIA